jgi:hypothetical protein
MRRRYLYPSLIVAAWAALTATVGGWLGWSEDVVLGVVMLMVAVMVLVVGLREEAHEGHKPRPGGTAGS